MPFKIGGITTNVIWKLQQHFEIQKHRRKVEALFHWPKMWLFNCLWWLQGLVGCLLLNVGWRDLWGTWMKLCSVLFASSAGTLYCSKFTLPKFTQKASTWGNIFAKTICSGTAVLTWRTTRIYTIIPFNRFQNCMLSCLGILNFLYSVTLACFVRA